MKKPIFIINPSGKTEDQISKEVMEAVDKFKNASEGKSSGGAPDYFMYDDKPVHWVDLGDDKGRYETKDGQPVPMSLVFEEGSPITEDEFNNA